MEALTMAAGYPDPLAERRQGILVDPCCGLPVHVPAPSGSSAAAPDSRSSIEPASLAAMRAAARRSGLPFGVRGTSGKVNQRLGTL